MTVAFQYWNSIHPSTGCEPVRADSGLEFNPIGGLRIGLASRIAINDDARALLLGEPRSCSTSATASERSSRPGPPA